MQVLPDEGTNTGQRPGRKLLDAQLLIKAACLFLLKHWAFLPLGGSPLFLFLLQICLLITVVTELYVSILWLILPFQV